MNEIIYGALAGGGFQVVSEVFKIGGSMISALRDSQIANNEQARLNIEAMTKERNAAASRGSSGLRWVLAVIVFVSAFLLSFVAGYLEMPTSIVTDKEPFSFLFGLIEFGSKQVVTTAQGFVMGPEFWSTVRTITGFVFGVGAVSTGRRVM